MLRARRGPAPYALERVTVPMARTPFTAAVVSDTHSKPDARALEQLAALRPDVVLHGGDVGELEVLERLSRIAPVHAVRGNIDTRTTLPDGLVLSFTEAERTVLTVLLTHVAVAGPKLRADAARRAKAERCSLVVCGHSHVPFLSAQLGLTVFNPGSIGPRRFTLPILYGVLRIGADAVTLEHIDCATGRVWKP